MWGRALSRVPTPERPSYFAIIGRDRFRIIERDRQHYLRASSKASWPKVILLDIRMPHMDGFELAQELQRAFAEIPPLLFFTSSSHPRDLRRAAGLGIPLRNKPMDFDDYVGFLQSL